MGKKKQPMYRIVVMDGRRQRDSRYIEQIGRYEPLANPSVIEVDNEKAAAWLAKGAKPSERVEKLLNISGAMTTMKVRTGQVHVVGVEKSAAPVAAAPVEEAVEETAAAAEEATEVVDEATETVEEATEVVEEAVEEAPAEAEAVAEAASEEE